MELYGPGKVKPVFKGETLSVLFVLQVTGQDYVMATLFDIWTQDVDTKHNQGH